MVNIDDSPRQLFIFFQLLRVPLLFMCIPNMIFFIC